MGEGLGIPSEVKEHSNASVFAEVGMLGVRGRSHALFRLTTIWNDDP